MVFNIDDAITKLSISDKIQLLSGAGLFHTHSIPQAGIPSIKLTDGPNGVKGTQFVNGSLANCFPCATGLAASFDVKLAQGVGEALGRDAHARSCHVLLGPTVNTQRSPLGGRSFESFSEDPYLNGTMAAAYIDGVQSTGVASTLKHFVGNDQEFQRYSISCEIPERALREIYLKPFQIAIKNANPWAIMAAYNRVNGVHVSENKRLLGNILRKEWGYKGMIMSDWTGTSSTVEAIRAGLDLEMPGPTVMRGQAVERALVCGKLLPSDIDARARKVLELVKRAIGSGIPINGPETRIDTPEIRHLMREAAADAIVLLKNSQNLLPLKSPKRIAVVGPNAKEACTSGGGSADLQTAYAVSPLEGIIQAAKEVGAEVSYALGAELSIKTLQVLNEYILQPDGRPGGLLEFWNEEPHVNFLEDLTMPSPPNWSMSVLSTKCILVDGVDADKVNTRCWARYTTTFTPDESGDWEFSLNVFEDGVLFIDGQLVIDLTIQHPPGESFFRLSTSKSHSVVKNMKAGKSYGLELRISNVKSTKPDFWGGFRIGGRRMVNAAHELLEAVEVAKAADVVILVVGLNRDWECSGSDRDDLDLPGNANSLVSEVLKANPNTVVVNQSGSAVSMPWIEEASTVVQAFYGGNELGNALADVLFGKVNPSGKLPLTFPKRVEDIPASGKGQEYGKIFYNEGIFVGYRWYDTKAIEPLFPFGHGLSYTRFAYSNLTLSSISLPDHTSTVTFTIENVGSVAGKESSQIYITDPKSSLPRPVKELKAFTKVYLELKETKEVSVALGREAFGFYDDGRRSWVAEKGTFSVLVAASSVDVRLRGEVELQETVAWN